MSGLKYFYKENAHLEGKLDTYFRTLSEYNDVSCGGDLSVILLGSLSRGEATWMEKDGKAVMLSDIEFFTVFPEGFTAFEEFTAFMDSAASEIFADQDSELFHIDNSFVCRTSLGSMERKLLTYDDKQIGKAAVGRDDVEHLPEITLANINLWDIRDILTQRVFSVLYYGLPLKRQGKEEEYRYNLAKNSLDLMTVLLAVHGKLESGFINRLEAVRRLPVEESVKHYFEHCLSIKLSTQSEHVCTIEQMEEQFLQLLKELDKQMKVPLGNTVVNAPHVVRRVLGMCKRAVKHKYVPAYGHLKRLIHRFAAKQELTQQDLKSNLVINGYPLE